MILERIRNLIKNPKREKSFAEYISQSDGMDVECSLDAFSHSSRCERLLLNRYGTSEIEDLLRQSGFTEGLTRLGFPRLDRNITHDDMRIHTLRIYDRLQEPDRLLVDIRLSEKSLSGGVLKGYTSPPRKTFDLLSLEWISLQNPRGKFTRKRPQLPGQLRPGLSLLRETMEFLRLLGACLSRDGVMTVADHYHAALMYSRYCSFTDPLHEGLLRAALRDLAGYSLPDISWGFLTQTVVNRSTGKPQEFSPSPQIMPISEEMKEYFNSRDYRQRVKDVAERAGFSLDGETMKKRRKALLASKNISAC